MLLAHARGAVRHYVMGCCGEKEHVACDCCENKVASINKLLKSLQKFPFGLLKFLTIACVVVMVSSFILAI